MQENDYLFLLYKQLNGEITPAETVQLDEWLRQSPDNQQLAADVRQVWAQTGSYTPAVAADPDAGFARVQAKIRAADMRPGGKIIPIGRQLVRLAAALALVLAAVWAFRQWSAPVSTARIEMAENDAKRLLDLPDGSRVWLRQGGRLEFPQQFSGAERRVRLDGEAYFEVAHNAAQPFRVEMPGGEQVEVLGTQFAVRALPGEAASVLVKTGKVHFSPDGRQEGAYLTAGKKAVFDRKSARITLSELTSFNELAWQAGGLEFVGTPLSQVVTDLENWYGVRIDLKNKALADCPHTAPLTDQPLLQVLNGLSVAYGLKISQPVSDQFVLEGGSCQ